MGEATSSRIPQSDTRPVDGAGTRQDRPNEDEEEVDERALPRVGLVPLLLLVPRWLLEGLPRKL